MPEIECPSCKQKMNTRVDKAYVCDRCKLLLVENGGWHWYSWFNPRRIGEVNYPIPPELSHPGVEFVAETPGGNGHAPEESKKKGRKKKDAPSVEAVKSCPNCSFTPGESEPALDPFRPCPACGKSLDRVAEPAIA